MSSVPSLALAHSSAALVDSLAALVFPSATSSSSESSLSARASAPPTARRSTLGRLAAAAAAGGMSPTLSTTSSLSSAGSAIVGSSSSSSSSASASVPLWSPTAARTSLRITTHASSGARPATPPIGTPSSSSSSSIRRATLSRSNSRSQQQHQLESPVSSKRAAVSFSALASASGGGGGGGPASPSGGDSKRASVRWPRSAPAADTDASSPAGAAGTGAVLSGAEAVAPAVPLTPLITTLTTGSASNLGSPSTGASPSTRRASGRSFRGRGGGGGGGGSSSTSRHHELERQAHRRLSGKGVAAAASSTLSVSSLSSSVPPLASSMSASVAAVVSGGGVMSPSSPSSAVHVRQLASAPLALQQQYAQLFAQLEPDFDQTVGRDEIIRFMRRYGIAPNPELLSKRIKEVLHGSAERFTLSSFAVLMNAEARASDTEEAELRRAFALLDLQETGVVSVSTLRQRLRLAGVAISADEWHALLGVARASAAGTFDYSVLIARLLANKPLHPSA